MTTRWYSEIVTNKHKPRDIEASHMPQISMNMQRK